MLVQNYVHNVFCHCLHEIVGVEVGNVVVSFGIYLVMLDLYEDLKDGTLENDVVCLEDSKDCLFVDFCYFQNIGFVIHNRRSYSVFLRRWFLFQRCDFVSIVSWRVKVVNQYIGDGVITYR